MVGASSVGRTVVAASATCSSGSGSSVPMQRTMSLGASWITQQQNRLLLLLLPQHHHLHHHYQQQQQQLQQQLQPLRPWPQEQLQTLQEEASLCCSSDEPSQLLLLQQQQQQEDDLEPRLPPFPSDSRQGLTLQQSSKITRRLFDRIGGRFCNTTSVGGGSSSSNISSGDGSGGGGRGCSVGSRSSSWCHPRSGESSSSSSNNSDGSGSRSSSSSSCSGGGSGRSNNRCCAMTHGNVGEWDSVWGTGGALHGGACSVQCRTAQHESSHGARLGTWAAAAAAAQPLPPRLTDARSVPPRSNSSSNASSNGSSSSNGSISDGSSSSKHGAGSSSYSFHMPFAAAPLLFPPQPAATRSPMSPNSDAMTPDAISNLHVDRKLHAVGNPHAVNSSHGDRNRHDLPDTAIAHSAADIPQRSRGWQPSHQEAAMAGHPLLGSQRGHHVLGLHGGNGCQQQRQQQQRSHSKLRHMSTLTASANGRRSLLIDTLALVRRLEAEGLSSKQAEAITHVMTEVLHGSLDTAAYAFASKNDMQKAEMMAEAALTNLRAELQSAYDIKLAALQREVEALRTDLDKVKSEIRYEVDKVTAGQRLDLNLERGRVKEELNTHRQETSTLANQLDKEINSLRAQLEAAKFEVIRYCVGTLVSVTAIGLGILRVLL